MADDSKRPGRLAERGSGLDQEEIARLRQQTHGVIDGKPAPLPLEPEPTGVGAAPAGKRRGAEPQPVDDSATVPVSLVSSDALSPDITPPPLPPSPAASAAEVWLEEAVTRPSAFAHIASLVGASGVGHSPGGATPAEGSMVVHDPTEHLREAHAQALRSMRIMLILSSITAFAVGLALGALLFRG